jgi:hypothetical protein
MPGVCRLPAPPPGTPLTPAAAARRAVPVVDYHASFDDLYDGSLPVVRVRDWRNLTPGGLAEEWREIEARAPEFDLARVYWPYWLARLTRWMPRVR